jgi:RNA polymerase sigma factor (TIGR02999 family)
VFGLGVYLWQFFFNEVSCCIPMSDVTVILQAVSRGEKQASEELLPRVYAELRHLAAARMAREAAGQTLQPTALVHEAWLRLVDEKDREWRNRSYFFAAAAEAMRRILIENARRKARYRHGGGQQRLNIEGVELAQPTPDEKLLMVDDALAAMEEEHPELARIVTLKYFTGLTNKEVAETLGVSESTVDRQWFSARRWLFSKIQASI